MSVASAPSVLVVADPERIAELAAALSEPLPQLGELDILISSGSDDTIDSFKSRRPEVVVLTATLEAGDAKSLIDTLRHMVPRAEVAIVVIGDADGPIRTALDALDLAPERFVSRPLAAKALRFAVASAIEMVRLARGTIELESSDLLPSTVVPVNEPAEPAVSPWSSSSTGSPHGGAASASAVAATAGSSPGIAASASTSGGSSSTSGQHRLAMSGAADSASTSGQYAASSSGLHGSGAGSTSGLHASPGAASAPTPGPHGSSMSGAAGSASASGLHEASMAGVAASASSAAAPGGGIAASNSGPSAAGSGVSGAVDDGPTASTRAALRARWEALADSIGDAEDLDDMIEPIDEPAPLPPVAAKLRRPTEPGIGEPAPHQAWNPGTTDELAANDYAPVAPPREPTLIIGEHAPPPPAEQSSWPSRVTQPETDAAPPPSAPFADDSVNVTSRSHDDHWSEPMPLAALLDRDSGGDLHKERADLDELPLDDFDDELVIGHDPGRGQLEVVGDAGDVGARAHDTGVHDNRDFARQLRAKMSMMAQRLFQGDAASSPAVDLGPRHDHHTEIDLASLGEEPALGAGVTEVGEARSPARPSEQTTSPGTWDTQVRERGLPDAGEIMRGVSDAAMLLAKMFAQGATGRVGMRRDDFGERSETMGGGPAGSAGGAGGNAPRAIEKVVFFDQGRPVFAASNNPRDRMGELLVREGKITAAQFERCQTQVAESGRRMGEILVDFGYLKRRELLPAVRRHVEDIVYSLFGWDRGTYRVTVDATPSAERIRLSRHPASLILEGIRRKLDRTSLDRLVGAPSTVIEVRDRDRLGGVINTGELGPEERAALAAFDGQADLATVARVANVDIADVLPFAWGLCVLGLAIARRTDTELADESTALVGETDLAIDRERVRARWQLVTEADYFALLGVRRDATAFEIRRAYQAARRDFAADCFPQDLRRELAQELDDIAHVLDEAFRVLRDDRLRQTYLANLIE